MNAEDRQEHATAVHEARELALHLVYALGRSVGLKLFSPKDASAEVERWVYAVGIRGALHDQYLMGIRHSRQMPRWSANSVTGQTGPPAT